MGLDGQSKVRIRIAHPGDRGDRVQRRIKPFSVRARDDNAHFSGDQFRADIVGMTTDPEFLASTLQDSCQIGSQIRVKRVVTSHQFVKLPTTTDILILEKYSFSWFYRADHRLGHGFLDSSQNIFPTLKEPGDHPEAVGQCPRP